MPFALSLSKGDAAFVVRQAHHERWGIRRRISAREYLGELRSSVERSAPRPRAEGRGIGLCLSGGGFRAALFHLGALRRLNELDILSRLRTISSVSGGSIMAAHLATAVQASVHRHGPDWEDHVARALRGFTGKHLRTRPILDRLYPGNWFTSSAGVEALAAA